MIYFQNFLKVNIVCTEVKVLPQKTCPVKLSLRAPLKYF